MEIIDFSKLLDDKANSKPDAKVLSEMLKSGQELKALLQRAEKECPEAPRVILESALKEIAFLTTVVVEIAMKGDHIETSKLVLGAAILGYQIAKKESK